MGSSKDQLVVGVYVDDLILAGADIDRIVWLQKALSTE